MGGGGGGAGGSTGALNPSLGVIKLLVSDLSPWGPVNVRVSVWTFYGVAWGYVGATWGLHAGRCAKRV